MSSKSSRHRHRSPDGSSESDGEPPGRKRHHHRHHHGQRDRHQSRSRSPKHRVEKAERHSRSRDEDDKHSHSRHRDHKATKHRDKHNEDNRQHDGHHNKRREKETGGNRGARNESRHHDGDTGRGAEDRNGERRQTGSPRGKWDSDSGAEPEPDDPREGSRRPRRSRENSQPQAAPGPIRIKQEREWNDGRRAQDASRKPPNPFETTSGEAGPSESAGPPKEKEKPNFGTSGKLTEDTNTYRGVVIKYNEPPEARKPKRKWRFYVFKGDQELPIVHIHRQSAYLLGRERLIADLPIDHPSCSKQHAVLQYRLIRYERADGTTGKRVRPYIIDLESSNGTYINNKRIEPKRYYELQERDVVKFGYSTREYVLLHDKSKDDNPEEDVGED